MPSLFARTQQSLRVFAPRKAVVQEAEILSPSLARLRFQGEALRAMWPLRSGQQLSLLVEGMWPRGGRNYSIARSNERDAWVELFIHTHSNSAGSRFARRACIGQNVQLWGPGGGFYAPHQAKSLLYLSDETGLGSAIALLDASEQARACIAVNDPQTAQRVEQLQPRIQCVIRAEEDQRTQSTRDHALTRWLACQDVSDATQFMLTGRIRSCYLLRDHLLERGIARSHIHVRGYWDDARKSPSERD